MGYTHYYGIEDWKARQWKKAWKQLVLDVPSIVKASSANICGETRDGKSCLPTIDQRKGIYLNGVGDEGHEPLTIYPNWRGWYVKTARRQYDEVIACVLLRAHMLAPSCFYVRSDGNWDHDWADARRLYRRAFPGQPIWCPWEWSAALPKSPKSASIMKRAVGRLVSRLRWE